MDIITITTQHNPEMADELSHTYMVLQWLCKEDPQYKSYWGNIKRKHNDAYVILDNGMNEKKPCTELELINTAYDIFADELICPDVYKDSKATIQKTTVFLNEYYDKQIKNRFNTMAVLQGSTEAEISDCCEAFYKDERIDFIGVGYKNLMLPFKDQIDKYNWDGVNEMTPRKDINTHFLKSKLEKDCYYYTLSRIYFLMNKVNYDDLKKYNKKIHLLGLWNSYELKLYTTMLTDYQKSFIRGCDSACLSQAAQEKIIFDKEFGVYDKPKAILNFDKRMTEDEKIIFRKNLEVMKSWLK